MKVNQITWNNYLYDNDHPATYRDIANVEDIGIKFPTDYLDIVKKIRED